jgi:sialate O-acetylesterase
MRKSPVVRVMLASLLVLCTASLATAKVELPSFFSDHMVLQQQAPLPVWGWADPGERVTVTLGDRAATARADAAGKWQVALPELPAGGPHSLQVSGDNALQIQDVWIGEVWLCSGQSNMAMTVSRAADFEQEQAAADYPRIRMFTVDRTAAQTPQDRCQGTWQVCSPETVGGFSATAYFFGRTLHRELDVPVGLINASWGGTPVQAWTSLAAQQAVPEVQPILDGWQQQLDGFDAQQAQAAYEAQREAWRQRVTKAKQAGQQPPKAPRPPEDPRTSPHRPANLYNGMIAPLAPYAIRGAIWYQGESNASRYEPILYGRQLATMIANWRQVWGQGEFPFAWVQLPNFRTPQEAPVQTDGWVLVQEQMLKTLAVPNTGMAVTIDVGEAGDIHPKNKQEVGRRLALWMLGTAYGQDLVYSGPLYKSMSSRPGKIAVTFQHVGQGLQTRGDQLKGFAIAGQDRQFRFADAEIVGPDTVLVSHPEVSEPIAVRYAWASNPDCNLVNSADLPASPFRTDNWEQ